MAYICNLFTFLVFFHFIHCSVYAYLRFSIKIPTVNDVYCDANVSDGSSTSTAEQILCSSGDKSLKRFSLTSLAQHVASFVDIRWKMVISSSFFRVYVSFNFRSFSATTRIVQKIVASDTDVNSPRSMLNH